MMTQGKLHAPGTPLDGMPATLVRAPTPGRTNGLARVAIGGDRGRASIPADVVLGLDAAGPGKPIVFLPIFTSSGAPLTPDELASTPVDSHAARARRSRLYDALRALADAYGEREVFEMARTMAEDAGAMRSRSK